MRYLWRAPLQFRNDLDEARYEGRSERGRLQSGMIVRNEYGIMLKYT